MQKTFEKAFHCTKSKKNHCFLLSEPPVFDTVPTNATAVSGEDIFLECSASGDPSPKTRWTRVDPKDPVGSELLLDSPRFKEVPGRGLRLRHVHPAQAGLYKCTASSSIGTGTHLGLQKSAV